MRLGFKALVFGWSGVLFFVVVARSFARSLSLSLSLSRSLFLWGERGGVGGRIFSAQGKLGRLGLSLARSLARSLSLSLPCTLGGERGQVCAGDTWATWAVARSLARALSLSLSLLLWGGERQGGMGPGRSAQGGGLGDFRV